MLSQLEISEITNLLLNNYPIQKIILFGSQARKTADTKSDVDLLIITNEIKDRFELMRKMRKDLINLKYAFDIIALSNDEYERDKLIPGTLSRYASIEGKVLHEVN